MSDMSFVASQRDMRNVLNRYSQAVGNNARRDAAVA